LRGVEGHKLTDVSEMLAAFVIIGYMTVTPLGHRPASGGVHAATFQKTVIFTAYLVEHHSVLSEN
jgi:hypothetical protein